MKSCSLHFIALLLAGMFSVASAATYRAHDPAWRGVWLWQRVASNAATAQLVDMRAFIEEFPGACQLSLVNRIAGRAMGGGINEFYVRFVDKYGNLLYPAADRSRVLHFDNWGLDFGGFDYIRAWAELGQRTRCRVVFVGPQEELAAFQAIYPDFEAMPLDRVPKGALKGTQVNAENLAQRNLLAVPMEFRHEFTLDDEVAEAKICITATGTYELFVNGVDVGQDSDWILSETYDVTKLMKAGQNLLEVSVDPDKELPGLIVNTNIRLANGDVVHVDSDLDWQCRAAAGVVEAWQTPVQVGFEGAGPRYRLREAFKYPAKTRAVRPETLVKASDCAAIDASATAALNGVSASNNGEYLFEFAEPLVAYEVRIVATGVKGCRVYGRTSADGEWLLLAAPYVYGQGGPSSYRNGKLNLPFAPVRLQALKLVEELVGADGAVMERVEIVKSDEK